MSTTVPTIQVTVPDSPSGTSPSTHSESDWSLHTTVQQVLPSLILDASSPLLSQCKSSELPALLERFKSLPLPITGIDGAPDQTSPMGKTVNGLEAKFGTVRNGAEVAFGTKVIQRGSHLGLGSGELHADQVRASLRGSLGRLHRKQVSWLIAQRPDFDVSLGEVTGGFEALIHEGLCENWGVRDFRTRQLRDVLMTCRRRGYGGPKIYQGEYNLLWRRSVEARISLIREHDMSIHAFEPFAKGALIESTIISRPSLQSGTTAWKSQYGTPEMQEAIQSITTIATKCDLTLQSAGLRWLAYHSELGQKDGIILSASSFEDLEDKIACLVKGPLPDEMVGVLNGVGEDLRHARPSSPE